MVLVTILARIFLLKLLHFNHIKYDIKQVQAEKYLYVFPTNKSRKCAVYFITTWSVWFVGVKKYYERRYQTAKTTIYEHI